MISHNAKRVKISRDPTRRKARISFILPKLYCPDAAASAGYNRTANVLALLLLPSSQPYTGAATVLVDELDVGMIRSQPRIQLSVVLAIASPRSSWRFCRGPPFWGASTTLADLFTLRVCADPPSAMRASPWLHSSDELKDGVTNGW